MGNRRTKWIYSALALVLVLALLSACFLGSGFARQEPEAEIPTGPAAIRTEGAGAKGQDPAEETEPQQTEPEETELPTQPPSEPQQEPQSPTTPEATTPEQPEPVPGTEPTTGPGAETDPTGPEDDSKLKIVTDLTGGVMTYDQLTQDILPFYAYIVNGEADEYLRVKLRNSLTSGNGTYLTPDGRDYTAKLARQERNVITLYVKRGAETVYEVTYTIFYTAKKADAGTPEVGEHPPTIRTNLDGWTEKITNRNFTFQVTAKTWEDKTIFASNIQVRMDGKVISNPTGGPTYEYELYFPDPVRGDEESHKISVLAWDQAGNSTYVEYTVIYSLVDSGGVVGKAYVVLDATTVGLAPWDLADETFTYEIKQDEPASYAVLAMLKYFDFEVQYGGTLDHDFYIRRISRPGMADYAQIPENLWQKVLADGLNLTGARSYDSLGEFDYTQGSGWMYSVNGVLYAGKSLSRYYLNDGDTIYLRFTLAYGKDIGGYSATGGSYGLLPTYCGKWINGTYIDQHQWGQAQTLKEPTCTEPGEVARVCAVCGDHSEIQTLEPLGHDFVETARQEPIADADGWVRYRCTRCGEEKTEVLSRCANGHTPGPAVRVREPDCENPGLETVSCTVCGSELERKELPALGHTYVETGRQEPTEEADGWIKYRCTRCGGEKTEPIPRKKEDNP